MKYWISRNLPWKLSVIFAPRLRSTLTPLLSALPEVIILILTLVCTLIPILTLCFSSSQQMPSYVSNSSIYSSSPHTLNCFIFLTPWTCFFIFTLSLSVHSSGNKEKVKCASGKVAFRACDKVLLYVYELALSIVFYPFLSKVRWVEERKFWIFESAMFLVSGISYALVFLRQKQHVRSPMLIKSSKPTWKSNH